MKRIGWTVSIFFLLTLESGFFGQLGFLPVTPWLAVIFCAVAIVLIESPRDLLYISVVTGVMLDIISSLPDGVLLISLLVSIYLTYRLIYLWLAKDYHVWLLFVSSSVLSALFFLLTLIIIKLFSVIGLSGDIDYVWSVTHKFLWYIVSNAVMTYPIYLYFVFAENFAKKLFKIK